MPSNTQKLTARLLFVVNGTMTGFKASNTGILAAKTGITVEEARRKEGLSRYKIGAIFVCSVDRSPIEKR